MKLSTNQLLQTRAALKICLKLGVHTEEDMKELLKYTNGHLVTRGAKDTNLKEGYTLPTDHEEIGMPRSLWDYHCYGCEHCRKQRKDNYDFNSFDWNLANGFGLLDKYIEEKAEELIKERYEEVTD